MAVKSSDGKGEHDLNCLNIDELEKHAYNLMDKQTRDYYNEGADSGSTLRENIEAFGKYRIRPRVLRDVSNIDTSVDIFGHKNSIPMGVAPTAMQCLAHSDGELGTARACKAAKVAMGLSSFATTSLEDVAEASGDNPHVLQLYLFEDRGHSHKLIQRAKKAGYKAVLLTVDTPFLGRRNLEIRNQFKLPPHFKIANFAEDEEAAMGDMESSTSANQARQRKQKPVSTAGYHDGEKRVAPTGPITFHSHAANPSLCWEKDIEWLKQECCPEMEVWVKGIATGEDAILAVHHGVSGIVVSNHGGRQLNGALATLDALPEVVDAVQGKIPVHVDGGIRHGTDVFKALALGADFCWVGRPALWGLAYKGQAGVELMLRLLSDEIKLCMALAGVTKVQDISKEYLVKVSAPSSKALPTVEAAHSGTWWLTNGRLTRAVSWRDSDRLFSRCIAFCIASLWQLTPLPVYEISRLLPGFSPEDVPLPTYRPSNGACVVCAGLAVRKDRWAIGPLSIASIKPSKAFSSLEVRLRFPSASRVSGIANFSITVQNTSSPKPTSSRAI